MLKNRGITLIALVVTIVVLLILAGVSISMLGGENGIIRRATEGKERTNVGEEKEHVGLAVSTSKIDTLGKKITVKEIQDNLDKQGAKATATPSGKNITVTFDDSGRKYTVNENGEITEKEEIAPTEVWYKIDGTTLYFNNMQKDGSYRITEEYYENFDTGESNYPEWNGYWDNEKNQVISGPIEKVVIENKISPTSTALWFNCCGYLTTIENLENLDTSNVTDMYYMFSDCWSLANLDVSTFDTSKVTNMNSMFYGCESLVNLDVRNFDTSNVIDMYAMFCYDFYSNLKTLDVSNFNTSKVMNMSFMFKGCTELTNLDVSNFDTSNVENMKYMFGDCSSLTSLDVSNFDTTNVIDMDWMFGDCSSLTSLDLSNFDTTNVTDMHKMFIGCTGLTTTLDLSNFNTLKVTVMANMFKNVTVEVKIGEFWNPAMTPVATGYAGNFT